MKSLTTLALAFAGLTLSNPILSPRQQSAPDPPIPIAWQFSLVTWSGAGCPDYPSYTGNETDNMRTRATMGPYLFNSSADTFWYYISYPWMRLHLDSKNGQKTASINCVITVKYKELENEYGKELPKGKGLRLRLHKNGTTVEANYKLDKSVSAEWQVSYYLEESGLVEAVDYATIDGPSNGSSQFHWATPMFTSEQVKLPTCGEGTFRMRVTLGLGAFANGVSGTVNSKRVTSQGKEAWYGITQGFSYDWEQCYSAAATPGGE